MKNLIKALFVVAALFSPLKAAVISTTTANAGPQAVISLNSNESLTYSISGTFTGTAIIESSRDMTNWRPVGISTTNNSGSTLVGTIYAGPNPNNYRWNGTTITAGSFVYTMSDNDDFVAEQLNNKKVPVTQTYDDSFRVLGDITVTGSVSATGGISDPDLGDATADSLTVPFIVFSSTFSIATTTPTFVGQMALDSNYDVYVASGNSSPSQWIKVGGQ